MKTTMMILCAITMAACAVESPNAATSEQGLICSPYCDDPNDPSLPIMEATIAFGMSLFEDAQATSGIDWGCGVPTGERRIECSGVFETSANPFCTYIVHCVQQDWSPPRCTWGWDCIH